MTSSRRTVLAALISAGVLWGTTVPLSKVALTWLPPAGLAFTRFSLAAVILMLVSRSRLRAAVSPAILVSGALGYGGSVLIQNFAVERTSVTHAALLIGATPVLVAIMAALCRHSVARPAAWVGFSVSLAGVAVIASGKGGGATLVGDSLVLVSQFASAAFTVAQARVLRGRDPVAVTAVQLLAAAVATLPVALLTGGLHASHAAPVAVLATAALVVAGTVAPTTMFAFAQSRVPADVAGAFLNLEPLVGAAAGIVLFADPFGPAQLAGGVAVLAGIGLSSLHVDRGSRVRQAGPGSAPTASAAAATGPLTPAPAGLAVLAGTARVPVAVRPARGAPVGSPGAIRARSGGAAGAGHRGRRPTRAWPGDGSRGHVPPGAATRQPAGHDADGRAARTRLTTGGAAR